jgi:ankyrin repeat protein
MKNRFITFIKYFIGVSLLGAVLIVGSIFISYYNAPEVRLPRIIKEGDTKKIDKLIAKNGINAYYGDDTLLIYAIEANDKKTVEYLIKKGADINLISQVYGGTKIRGQGVLLNLTPLLIATEKGNKEISELLIKNGADVNAKNAWGETPLSLAKKRGYKEIVALLIANGAKE